MELKIDLIGHFVLGYNSIRLSTDFLINEMTAINFLKWNEMQSIAIER